MRMLKLSTIDLYYRIWVAIQNFRGSFNHACFSRAGRTKKEHGADGAIRRIHAGQKDLVKAAHAPDRALLPYDAVRKPLFEALGTRTLLIRIQEDGSHGVI